MATSLVAEYPIDPNSETPITITISIGYAQSARTSVHLGGKMLSAIGRTKEGMPVYPDSHGTYEGSFSLQLGTAATIAEIKNNNLMIISSIERVQHEERISMRPAVTGGVHDVEYELLTAKIPKGTSMSMSSIFKFTLKNYWD